MKYKIAKLTIFSIIGWITQLVLFVIFISSFMSGDMFSASGIMFTIYFVAFIQERIECKYRRYAQPRTHVDH